MKSTKDKLKKEKETVEKFYYFLTSAAVKVMVFVYRMRMPRNSTLDLLLFAVMFPFLWFGSIILIVKVTGKPIDIFLRELLQ